MKKVNVYMANGFEEVEALTVIDVLRRAELDVRMIAVGDSLEVFGAHKVCIKADEVFENDNLEVDMLVLPGGMPGAANLMAHSGLNEKIKAFARDNKYIAAICAAPMVFGKAGILKDRQAVCYPGFEGYLENANIGSDIVVVDNNIITSKGPGTAIYFALKLVEILVGLETAEALKKGMLVQ